MARIPGMAVKLTNPEPRSKELKRSFDEIRSARKLRELTDEEDGGGSDGLPVGLYGFTYSPCADNFPFFKAHDLRSYEAHKHSDGSVVLLGFLTADEKKALETATGVSTLHLFPRAQGRSQSARPDSAQPHPESRRELPAGRRLGPGDRDRLKGLTGYWLPWCTTRDLGPQLSCTHGFEVPHEHFQTHSAEVCEEGHIA